MTDSIEIEYECPYCDGTGVCIHEYATVVNYSPAIAERKAPCSECRGDKTIVRDLGAFSSEEAPEADCVLSILIDGKVIWSK